MILSSLVEYPPAERQAEGRWVLNVWECLYCVSSACVLECESSLFMPVERQWADHCQSGTELHTVWMRSRVCVCSSDRGREVDFFLYTLDVYVWGVDCTCVTEFVCVCVWATDHSQESQRALLLMLLQAFLFPVLLSSALFSHPLFLSSLSPLILFHLRPLIRSLSTMGAKDKLAALGYLVWGACACVCVCVCARKTRVKTQPLYIWCQSQCCVFNIVVHSKSLFFKRLIWCTCFIAV